MDNRGAIFRNLLNGVPVWQVARDFHISESEVNSAFSYVLRKIKSFCFQRSLGYREPGSPSAPVQAMPIIPAGTIEEAKKYRLSFLSVLEKLNLDKPPAFKDIQTETVTPDNIMTVARNLSA